MKYFIKTFGCQQNTADSERIASYFKARGMEMGTSETDTNYMIINTCMIRHAPQNRVNGIVHNLNAIKQDKLAKGETYKIIVTGCMTGMAVRDATGKFMAVLKEQMPEVDEFMPIEEAGFDFEPLRLDNLSASVPISNGCNNYCTYCVVPYTRGREISRPYANIISECRKLKANGFQTVTLLGQNVNSYGSDIIKNSDKKPVYVKHLGKTRIPTLFPHLLEEVAQMGFKLVNFISSNPWDFSEDLIDVIARNSNVTRGIHLPVQSGDTAVLKRMNRWYTREEYLNLVARLKNKISGLRITTDIIVGFCGETDAEFENTVNLVKEVDFEKAYVAMYSKRPLTIATQKMNDDVPYAVKKHRWDILEDLIYTSKFKKKV